MGFIKTTIVQDPLLDFTVEGKGSLYKHARQGMFKWSFEDNAVITNREMDENERKSRKAVKNSAKSKAMPKKGNDDKKGDKKDNKKGDVATSSGDQKKDNKKGDTTDEKKDNKKGNK